MLDASFNNQLKKTILTGSIAWMIIQITGLSGAGKSTIANHARQRLQALDIAVEVIDGDYYRKTICEDLGFSKEDRQENIRRLGAAAADFSRKNIVVLLAAINPYIGVRNELLEKYNARIVYVKCPISTLIQRDTKGLYKRALLPDEHPEKIFSLSGINDPYEIPENAALILDTDVESIEQSVEKLYQLFINNLKS